MRKIELAPDEYYHLYNRGMAKRNIFLDDGDRTRFLFLILYLQSPEVITKPERAAFYFNKYSNFNIDDNTINLIIKDRYLSLMCFALMPNHFHLLVKNGDNGIPQYMQRVLNAYTKYFNIKYKTSGHLLQGPYQVTHIENNNHLLHASAYIHKNPQEIKADFAMPQKYRWSSYQDYVVNNRWGRLLETRDILEQFDSKENYLAWVKDNPAKELLPD